LVISGENQIVKTGEISKDYDVIIGYPKDLEIINPDILFDKEKDNFKKFKDCGMNYGQEIAYNVFHKILPAINEKNLSKIGEVIYDYRFNKGSIINCSFSYPKLVEVTNNLSFLKKESIAEVLSISSVGPLVFAITKNPEECISAFKKNGLNIIQTKIENRKYLALEKTRCSKKGAILGVLGGIGPEATAEFYSRLINAFQKNKKIKENSDYPKIIINSLPAKEIIYGETNSSDLEDYISGVKELDIYNPDFIILVCNTVYLFKNKLQEEISSLIIDLRKIVLEYLTKNNIKSYFILGSKTTIDGGLYKFKGFNSYSPNIDELGIINKIISEYNSGIKNLDQIKDICKICDKYLNEGAESIIMGCTELELLMREVNIKKINVIDLMVEEIISKLG